MNETHIEKTRFERHREEFLTPRISTWIQLCLKPHLCLHFFQGSVLKLLGVGFPSGTSERERPHGMKGHWTSVPECKLRFSMVGQLSQGHFSDFVAGAGLDKLGRCLVEDKVQLQCQGTRPVCACQSLSMARKVRSRETQGCQREGFWGEER